MTGLCIILIDAEVATTRNTEKGAFGHIQADVCHRI